MILISKPYAVDEVLENIVYLYNDAISISDYTAWNDRKMSE
jgi:hypothetical protein